MPAYQHQANNRGARWHEYSTTGDTATDTGRRDNLWGNNNNNNNNNAGYVSFNDDTSTSSDEEGVDAQQRHNSIQQLHLKEVRPTSTTSWVIPSTIAELSSPPRTRAMAVTPDKVTTPSRSNRRVQQQHYNSSSGIVGGTQRSLQTSHRKKRLHCITPKARPIQNIVAVESSTAGEKQQPSSDDNNYPTPKMQHRGNGVVLDLTSLFLGDGTSKQPSATETTATTTSHNNNNHLFGKSNAYSSPAPPPWRMQAATTGIAAATSPMTVPGGQQDRFDTTSHAHTHHTRTPNKALQWDTKSQTTQEALLTERQCQALTQWMNFALAGDQSHNSNDEEVARVHKKKLVGRGVLGGGASHGGDSFDLDDDTMIQETRCVTPFTVTTTTGRSVTPTPTITTATTTTIRRPRAGTPTSRRPGTPVTNITSDKRRRHRRLSMFQYSQSYDCANEQAHHWFQESAFWRDLRMKIRREIAGGKLTLREDRDLYANVAVREKLLEIFLSYRPAWLTLALEVVMDETLPPAHGHTLPSRKQLEHFIVTRVLSDDKLLSTYTQGGGSRVPTGQFGELYHAELRPLVLYRILVLVFFLDRAAGRHQKSLGNLFQSNPEGNTFKTKGKSSAHVLVTICREFLSRQGDIIKQLARVNLQVHYNQGRLDEIDYPVKNFAIDLRDGMRISRLVEILWLLPRNSAQINAIDKYPILSQLRIPAISRLQKIHNVNVALTALQEDCQIGLPQDLQAHHIVDGQRRMVLRLVWTMVLMHCFENHSLLSKQQLEGEIGDIQSIRKKFGRQREKRRQRQQENNTLQLLEQETDDLESVTVMMSLDGSKASRLQQQANRLPAAPAASLLGSPSFDEDEDDALSCNSNALLEELGVVMQWKKVLMQWCEQVCMVVEEKEIDAGNNDAKPSGGKWTSADLANGKALCCLIHYYHPALLPREELHLKSSAIDDGPPTRIQTIQTRPVQRQNKFRHTCHHQPMKPKMGPDYHIRLAHQLLTEIGGIPSMMLMPFSTHGKSHHRRKKILPLTDEKSILVYLYHIAGRLLESRHQVEAVIFVQQRYRYLSSVSWLKRKRAASLVIWRCWQENRNNYFRARAITYKRAVLVIETFTICYFDKLLLMQENRLERGLQNSAIAPIQVCARRFIAQQRYHLMLERHYAAIIIQSQYRQFRDYVLYHEVLSEIIPATTAIQRHWRGFVQRRTYASAIDATIEIQSFARGAVLVRKSLLGSWRDSSTCLQRIWRGFSAQLHYQMVLMDIVAVQCLVRKQQATQLAARKSSGVQVVQRIARGHLSRLLVAQRRQERNAATILQKSTRRFLASRWAAALRAKIALAHATLVVQRFWRRTQLIRAQNSASTKIQSQYRLAAAYRSYHATRASTIKVQSQWRQYSTTKQYLGLCRMIVFVQSCVRRWRYGVVIVKCRKAALSSLQNRARRWLAVRKVKSTRAHLVQLIQKAIICQAFARNRKLHQEWLRVRRSVQMIQKKWRLHCWVKRTARKWQLISSLVTCPLLFRRSQKGAFKIVPHYRRVVNLNKQALIRCGPKQIAVSNSATWAVPFRGHRQNVFRHRPHVQTVRLKYSSGVQLQELPRRKIGIRTLRAINQAAVQLQEPWQYPNIGLNGKGVECSAPVERIAQRYDERKLRRARKTFVGCCKALVKLKASSQEATITPSCQVASHLVAALALLLGRSEKVGRLLNLVRRNANPPSKHKRADDMYSLVQPVGNPWKIRALKSSAAKRIQNTWRGLNARNQFRVAICSVVLIQSTNRGCLTRQGQSEVTAAIAERRKLRQTKSATTIQRCWRGYSTVLRFKTAVRRIVALQGWSRSVLARKMLETEASFARRIQQVSRCHLARLTLSNLKLDKEIELATTAELTCFAIMLQSIARGHFVREELHVLRGCAIFIQKHVRGRKARVTYQANILNITKAQTTVRSRNAYKQFSQLQVADAVKRHDIDEKAVLKIQTLWRGFTCRSELMYTLLSIIQIQTWSRRHLQQQNYQQTLSKLILLQSVARGSIARKHTSNHCNYAILIQSYARVMFSTNIVLRRRKAITTLQQYSRGFLAREYISLENFAAGEIQKTWRCYDAGARYIFIIVSAIKIQSFFRMAAARKNRNELWRHERLRQESTTRVQCRWRIRKSLQQKSELEMRRNTAIRIQSILRRNLATQQVTELREQKAAFASMARDNDCQLMIIKLQSAVRIFLAKKQRALLSKERVAAVRIQSICRVPMAKKQKAALARERQIQQRKKYEKSTSIHAQDDVLHRRLSISQGFVRGYLTRKQSGAELRKSISLINEAELRSKLDPSLRLGARMQRALKLLQSSSNLTEIMNIVCTLEIATRFSKECCEEFVLVRATAILVALAPTCNKSLPHVELLYYIMCTLSNVSKHQSLVANVATVDAATAFVHLIRMYGSEDAIFCSAVSLLELCALQNSEVPTLIGSQKRLEGIYKSWERKLHHKKVIKPVPFKVVYKPQFLGKRSKAKTDMLILGISYDLDQGVSTLERLLKPDSCS